MFFFLVLCCISNIFAQSEKDSKGALGTPASISTTNTPCSGHGTYVDGSCICDPCYMTNSCEYKATSKQTVIILTVFLNPFGAGHFMAGNTGWGLLSLGITFLLIILFCGWMWRQCVGCGFMVLFVMVSPDEEKNLSCETKTSRTFRICLGLGIFIFAVFWIFSIIAYSTGLFMDGEGVPLC